MGSILLQLLFIFGVALVTTNVNGLFWSSKSSQQIDLTRSEVYEHPLSANKGRNNQIGGGALERVRRQAYPLFSSSGAEGGLTIETQLESGPWGQWGVQRECSRTCGGGVQIETRTCQGSGCTGATKRYVSCNIEPCPDGSGDFRNDQCAQFNDKPLEGRYFKWKAYNKGTNKCELLCIPEGENFYYKWMDKVIDGTRCDTMADDICVEGFCLPLGCDGRLGSTVKQDKCLVCGGDGTGCKTIPVRREIAQNLEIGYHDIVKIPSGATSILIQELKPTNNYLTLKNESEHYFLNGNWKIDFPQTLELAGTFFEYERTRQNGESFEKLSAKGPLMETIIIGILHQTEGTTIQAEYSIKIDEDTPYIYVVDQWGECSVTCGQGIQDRRASCVRALTREPVAEDLCVNASLPELNRTCTTEDCDSEWYVSEWEECSATCGNEGFQYRVSYCHQVRGDGTRVTVDDAKCLAITERPPVKQTCNRFPCPEWNTGPWSSCSKPCGQADQYRSITCRSEKEGDEGALLPDKACNASAKATDKRECNLGPCEGLRWVTSDWKLCDKCNDTTETRNVTCEDPSSRPFPDDKCPGKRPQDTRECATQPPCLYKWHASQWSECSTVCGHGHQTRGVVCTYEYQNKLHIIDDIHCDPKLKMPTRQNCTSEAECAGIFYTTNWNKCSVVCGGGTQTRSVLCLDYDFKVRPEMCDEALKPPETQECNLDTCIPCNETDFGCCPNNMTAATGPYLEGCSNCSTTEFGCCPDNVTVATGPDEEGCYGVEGSGEPPLEGPSAPCKESEFGCCPDGTTAATGPDSEGCLCNYTNPEGVSIEIPCVNVTALNDTIDLGLNDTDANGTIHCSKTEFGCCPDWYTPAEGPEFEGCPEIEIGECNATKYGCCPDGMTLSRGPDYSGCGDPACSATKFGCCKDRRTIAFGPHYKGCERSTLTCETGKYGCCPDGETTALGPNGKGCQEDCRLTKFGCCPDGNTAAKGPSNQGCGCIYSQFGCCPDGINSALGPNYYGCPQTCATSYYGCCPDGKTPASGPSFEGCHCRYTRFGCCPDGETAARGPNNLGCDDCHYAKWGCCPDGITKATGPNFQGCIPISTAEPPTVTHPPRPPTVQEIAACTQPSSIGEVCGPYQLKYFYDSDGNCRPFWYGGCGGTENRFDTEEQCRVTCIEPPGDGVCYLSKMPGPDGCGPTVIRYYYDITLLQCAPFYYHSCNSNQNNYVEYDQCMAQCQHITHRPWPFPQGSPQQQQQQEQQPIHQATHPPTPPLPSPPQQVQIETEIIPYEVDYPRVTQTPPGGHTQPQQPYDVCQLAPDSGPCRDFVGMWYFDRITRQCISFSYGGCQGNANRFGSKEECEHRCGVSQPVEVVPLEDENACDQPLDRGACGGRLEAYYYEKAVGECIRFEFTGCGGNSNRFGSKEQCEAKCLRRVTPAGDVCSYPKDTGRCDNYVAMWFFNSSDGTCGRFYYGGCHGNPNRFDSLHECTRQCAERVDPCSLPAVHGPCGSREARYYWDYNSRTCQEFVYGGCLGNSNNFKTLDMCLQRCSRTPSIPLSRPGVLTSSFDPGLKEGLERSAPLQNVVHPEFESFCLLPKEAGPCDRHQQKYYYDFTERKCTPFTYGGCDGNRNKFDTLEECQAICGNIDITPAVNASNSAQAQIQGGDVTENHEDVCSLPADQGPCTHQQLKRWYFDMARGECRQFVYGGCVGNHNNFATQENCQSYCSRHIRPHSGRLEKPDVIHYPGPHHHHHQHHHSTLSPLPTSNATSSPFHPLYPDTPVVTMVTPAPSTLPELCRQPKDSGSCYGDQIQFYYDWDKGKCISFKYTGCGGNTNRFQSEETCERACGLYKDQDVCSMPYDEGPCASNILKWRFDVESGKCVKFAYSGCGGNGNRFSSKEECESLCRQETRSLIGDPCEQPKEPGSCQSTLDRYYFNKTMGQCELFVYTGCKGNANNFLSKDTCEKRCLGRSTTSANGGKNSAVLVDEVCTLPRDPGPCTDLVSQWYFDHTDNECKLFTYGGCRGNGNRFNDRGECESRCKHASPLDRLTVPEPGTSHKPPVVQLISMSIDNTQSILLHCQTANGVRKREVKDPMSMIMVDWYKDGQRVNDTEDGRIQLLTNGTLKFTTINNADAGGYSCSFKTSGGIVSHPLNVRMQVSPDGDIQALAHCTQDLGITDCKKVVIGGLCRHKYYGPACCQSCARSALAKKMANAARKRRLKQR